MPGYIGRYLTLTMAFYFGFTRVNLGVLHNMILFRQTENQSDSVFLNNWQLLGVYELLVK